MRPNPSPEWNRKIPPLQFDKVGDLFMEALGTFINDFGLYAKIILLFVAPIELLYFGLRHLSVPGVDSWWMIGGYYALFFLATTWAMSVLLYTTMTLWQTGARPTMGSTMREGWRRFGPTLFALFGLWLATIVGLAALIVPGLWVFVRLSLAPVAAMLGKRSGPEAIKESFALTEDRTWLLGLAMLLAIAFLAAFFLLTFVVEFVVKLNFFLNPLAPVIALLLKLVSDVFAFFPLFVALHLYVALANDERQYFRHIQQEQENKEEELAARPLSLSGADEDALLVYNREQAGQAPDTPIYEQHREPIDLPAEDPLVNGRRKLIDQVKDDGSHEFELDISPRDASEDDSETS